METIRENLLREMNSVDLGKFEATFLKSVNELLYTAEETGVIERRLSAEDLEIILKLLVLAERYQYHPKGIPDELRL